jgi:soluble lytic murein transglycosylase-like protein
MPLQGFLTLILLILVGLMPEPARADVYTFTDAKGIVHFTNVPSDSRYSGMARTAYRRPAYKPLKTSFSYTQSPDRYASLLERVAREHSLDQSLLRALITVESGFNPNATSERGAIGLMQIMPETARRYGAQNPYDPAENVDAGAKYLRDLLLRFNNDLSLTLAAYNAGEGAIARYGHRIPPYRETLAYVPRVLTLYRQYQQNVSQ